jgi:hypothetical protein
MLQIARPLSDGVNATTKLAYSATVNNKYKPMMEFLGADPAVVNYSQWQVFALVLVARRVPPMQSESVVKLLSHLRTASGWLDLKISFAPEDTVGKFNTMLQKLYPKTGKARQLVGLRHLKSVRKAMSRQIARLQAALARLPLSNAALAAKLRKEIDRIEYSWTVFCLHHQGLLRNSELRGVTRREVKLVSETDADDSVHRRLRLGLWNTKGSPGQMVQVEVPERADEYDVYAPIARLMTEHAANDALLPDAASRAAALDRPFFDLTRMGQSPSTVDEAVTAELRHWLVAAGAVAVEDLAAYVCHSLRHGGASDLLDSGVNQDVVAKHGRWASLVWFEVYRHLSSLSTRQLLKLGTNEPGSHYF